jgi:ABC-2 type transport system ATP-binding protein
MQKPMIDAKGLTKWFGRVLAVDGIDFSIDAGQVVGFLGPNGAGKTTTIRMISGYLPPTAGSISVDGLDAVSEWRAVRQRIGYLPEAAPLYGEMRAEEFLDFRGKLCGLKRAERRKAIEKALDRCNLQEVRRRPIHQLSKGFRQRVGLAAAILHEPPVLILDEPTVGLDPSQILEFRKLIRELAGRHTVLLSTHILPEVEVTCDRVLMIARGRIRARGTIDELRAAAAAHSGYVVETDLANAKGVLHGVGGVQRISEAQRNGEWHRLTVEPKPNAGDLREVIARAIARHNGVVRELHLQTPSLEQLFVQTAAEAEADFARRETASDNRPVHADGATT